jgi:hypothetical protein
MKPPFQHQQQQQQRMQRDRMRGAAWQEQQNAKRRKKDRGAQVPGIPVGNKFNKIEAEVEKLKKSLAAGKLTETQFEERLNSLMFQDSSGIWWMVGAETGDWYYYDGSNWVPAIPSQAQIPGQPISSGVSSGPQSTSFMKRLSLKIEAIVIFGFGMAFVGYFGLVVGEIIAGFENQYWPFIGVGAIWIGGLFLISREARKKWRGE